MLIATIPFGCTNVNNQAADAANAVAQKSYETSFEDPDEFAKNWTIENGEWKIEEGSLIGEGFQIDNVGIWLKTPLSNHFEAEYEVEGLVAGNDLNCIVAGDGKKWSGYVVITGGHGGSKARVGVAYINDIDEIHHKPLRSTPFITEPNKTYLIKVTRTPDQIIMNIDGEDVLHTNKEDLIHNTNNQYFGFFTWDNKIKINSLKIKDLREEQ